MVLNRVIRPEPQWERRTVNETVSPNHRRAYFWVAAQVGQVGRPQRLGANEGRSAPVSPGMGLCLGRPGLLATPGKTTGKPPHPAWKAAGRGQVTLGRNPKKERCTETWKFRLFHRFHRVVCLFLIVLNNNNIKFIIDANVSALKPH